MKVASNIQRSLSSELPLMINFLCTAQTKFLPNPTYFVQNTNTRIKMFNVMEIKEKQSFIGLWFQKV